MPKKDQPSSLYTATILLGEERLEQINEYTEEKAISKSDAVRRAWDFFWAYRLRERHAPEMSAD